MSNQELKDFRAFDAAVREAVNKYLPKSALPEYFFDPYLSNGEWAWDLDAVQWYIWWCARRRGCDDMWAVLRIHGYEWVAHKEKALAKILDQLPEAIALGEELLPEVAARYEVEQRGYLLAYERYRLLTVLKRALRRKRR